MVLFRDKAIFENFDLITVKSYKLYLQWFKEKIEACLFNSQSHLDDLYILANLFVVYFRKFQTKEMINFFILMVNINDVYTHNRIKKILGNNINQIACLIYEKINKDIEFEYSNSNEIYCRCYYSVKADYKTFNVAVKGCDCYKRKENNIKENVIENENKIEDTKQNDIEHTNENGTIKENETITMQEDINEIGTTENSTIKENEINTVQEVKIKDTNEIGTIDKIKQNELNDNNETDNKKESEIDNTFEHDVTVGLIENNVINNKSDTNTTDYIIENLKTVNTKQQDAINNVIETHIIDNKTQAYEINNTIEACIAENNAIVNTHDDVSVILETDKTCIEEDNAKVKIHDENKDKINGFNIKTNIKNIKITYIESESNNENMYDVIEGNEEQKNEDYKSVKNNNKEINVEKNEFNIDFNKLQTKEIQKINYYDAQNEILDKLGKLSLGSFDWDIFFDKHIDGNNTQNKIQNIIEKFVVSLLNDQDTISVLVREIHVLTFLSEWRYVLQQLYNKISVWRCKKMFIENICIYKDFFGEEGKSIIKLYTNDSIFYVRNMAKDYLNKVYAIEI